MNDYVKNISQRYWSWLTLPIPFRKRDAEMRNLIVNYRDNITSSDIFDIEFGTGFLERNGATNPPNLEIDVKTFIQDTKRSPWERFKKSFRTVGYMRTNWGNNDNKKEMFINCAPILGQKYNIKHTLADLVGHEHMHLLQGADPHSKRTSYNAFDSAMDSLIQKQNPDAASPSDRITYLKTDYETQARLHTIIAKGTKDWGVLPKTRTELWAALYSRGVYLTQSISDEINEKMKTDFNAASFIEKSKKPNETFTYLDQLNDVQGSYEIINESAREAFWRVSLPYLYGHLLELYGIENGREMMGFQGAIDAKTCEPVMLGEKGSQHEVEDMLIEADKLRRQGDKKRSNILATLAAHKVLSFQTRSLINPFPETKVKTEMETEAMFRQNMRQKGIEFSIS